MSNSKAMAPNFCTDVEQEIGGEVFKGCYSVNASDSSVSATFNARTCYNDDGTGTGNAGTLVLTPSSGQTVDTPATPTTKCLNNQNCVDAGVGLLCNTSGSTGTCESAGTCS